MRRREGISTLLAFLSHPLVLVGVVVLVLFALYDRLIDAGVFPPLPPEDAAPVLRKLLDHGFVIGLTVVLLGFALQFYKLSRGRPLIAPSAEKTAELDLRNRQRMLKKLRRMWIEGVLEQSLYQVARIGLGLSEAPEAIEHPWKLVAQQPERKPQVLPDGVPMRDVFDQFDQTLLLLGAPGSGKTTLLLELARDLILRAEEDSAHPIPVVFNLSSWALTRPHLEAWLVDELNQIYDVPGKVADEWVDHDQILPLLDGLDEVAREHRDACVETINTFREAHGLLSLVVCCRSADYEALTVQLRVFGAVTIQPLTREQIEAYLERAGTALSGVAAAVRDDLTLWELLDTPLMLSILALAYQGRTQSDLRIKKLKGSLEERRAALFGAYIDAMFKWRDRAAPYTPGQTRHWLSWLAQAMVSHKQTVFYLERIQPDWLLTKHPHALQHRVRGGIVAGLTVGLGVLIGALVGAGLLWVITSQGQSSISVLQIVILVAGFIGPVGGALLGGVLGAGSFLGYVSDLGEGKGSPLPPVEALHWSWRIIWRTFSPFFVFVGYLSLGGGILLGLVFSNLAISYGWHSNVLLNIAEGFAAGFTISLTMALLLLLLETLLLAPVVGFVEKEISVRQTPNEGILRSLRNAFFVGSVGGSLLGLFFILLGGLQGGFFAVLFTLLFVGDKGGAAGIQHGVLRFLFWRYDCAPLNYVRFLDHATDLLFLRRVGGGYIFVHRLLMEHFAGMGEGGREEKAAVEEVG